MLTLKLFRQSDPFHLIEARSLEAGTLVIGRSDEADWALADPERLLSRRHCAIEASDEGAIVRDLSTNGVFIGRARERPRAQEPVRLASTETLLFGDYLLVVESAAPDAETARPPKATERAPLRAVQATADDPLPDAPLLEAFCAGAGLDPSAFCNEPPEAVLRRAGDMYRQMVVGLAGLMDERTMVKSAQSLERTAVGPDGNNPFRWAAADRVALDLLRSRDDGFLAGSDAVAASFADVRRHLACAAAGLSGAWGAALKALSPDVIEQSVQSRTLFGPSRMAALWRAFVATHASLADAPLGVDEGSPAGRAFGEAYLRRLDELHAADEISA